MELAISVVGGLILFILIAKATPFTHLVNVPHTKTRFIEWEVWVKRKHGQWVYAHKWKPGMPTEQELDDYLSGRITADAIHPKCSDFYEVTR